MMHRGIWIGTSMIVAGLALFACDARGDEAERNWHLFTQSYGGTVSLLHGLSKHECDFAMNRALGRPATEDEQKAEKQHGEQLHKNAMEYCAAHPDDVFGFTAFGSVSCSKGKPNSWSLGGTRMLSEGDIHRAECFQ